MIISVVSFGGNASARRLLRNSIQMNYSHFRIGKKFESVDGEEAERGAHYTIAINFVQQFPVVCHTVVGVAQMETNSFRVSCI